MAAARERFSAQAAYQRQARQVARRRKTSEERAFTRVVEPCAFVIKKAWYEKPKRAAPRPLNAARGICGVARRTIVGEGA